MEENKGDAVCTCGGDSDGDVCLALVGKREFEVCMAHRTYRPYGWKSTSLWLHVPMRVQLETAAKMHGFTGIDGICWEGVVAAQHIREFFAPYIESALDADPTLTREQLEAMSLDDMPLKAQTVPTFEEDIPFSDEKRLRAMEMRLRELRGESLALMLENETTFCGDGVCCVCGHRAYEAGLEFFLVTPLPAAKRTQSRDDEPRIIDTSQVCHYCAERCDPGLVAALRRMEATPLRDLSDCQSPLWQADDLPERLAEFGLSFIGERENRNIARAAVGHGKEN